MRPIAGLGATPKAVSAWRPGSYRLVTKGTQQFFVRESVRFAQYGPFPSVASSSVASCGSYLLRNLLAAASARCSAIFHATSTWPPRCVLTMCSQANAMMSRACPNVGFPHASAKDRSWAESGHGRSQLRHSWRESGTQADPRTLKKGDYRIATRGASDPASRYGADMLCGSRRA